MAGATGKSSHKDFKVTFDARITLGNLLQSGVIVVGIVGGYFAIVSGQQANTAAIERNTTAIEKLAEQASSADVLEYKVDQLTEAMARIETKLED